MESLLKVTPWCCYGINLNLAGYTLNVLSNCNGRNIHISVLAYDEEVSSPLLKQSICEKLDDLKIYSTNSIPTNFVQPFSEGNLNCDAYLILTL